MPDEALKSGDGRLIYEFAGLRLDPARRILERAGRPLPLYPRAFDALTLLVENPAVVLSKETLLERLWPRAIVEENSLARVVSDLRKELGEQAGCVVTVPRKGYRLDAEVRATLRPERTIETARRVLAVLPFAAAGDEEADRLLGFGLADALVTRLSQLKAVLVRPTATVAPYAEAGVSPAQAGRELKADVVISGSVRRSAGQVRVSVQLIEVAAEATFWAARFDEAAGELFSLEDSISARVADALALELTRSERQSLTRRPTHDAAAYQLYLRGRAWISRRVGESMRRAAECFQGAVERDPDFALAHAGLAEAYVLISIASATLEPEPPRVMAPLAKAAAQRALAIEPRLSEAHAILGHIGICYDWDWESAEASIFRALEINPANASARQYYAMGLSSIGRHDEALDQIRRARELDPTSMVHNANHGFILYRARRYAEAVEELANAVAVEASSAYARFRLGLALQAAGRPAEAMAQFDAMLELPKAQMHALVGKGHLLASTEQRDEARQVLARLQAMARDRYVSAYYFAEIHVALGEIDAALDWLEAALEERPVMMISLLANPKLEPLRPHPRFQDVVRRVGLWPAG